jgi:hypothetical protein
MVVVMRFGYISSQRLTKCAAKLIALRYGATMNNQTQGISPTCLFCNG